METVKVQLRIPEDLHATLIEWAKRSHRSMNGQIVAALESILQSQMKTVTQPKLSKGNGSVTTLWSTKHGR